jgi:hypothetical protein
MKLIWRSSLAKVRDQYTHTHHTDFLTTYIISDLINSVKSINFGSYILNINQVKLSGSK